MSHRRRSVPPSPGPGFCPGPLRGPREVPRQGRAQTSQVARALAAGRNPSAPGLSDGSPAPAPGSRLEYQDQGKALEESPPPPPPLTQVTLQATPGPEEVVKKHIPPPCSKPFGTKCTQTSIGCLHIFTDNPGIYLLTHLSTGH